MSKNSDTSELESFSGTINISVSLSPSTNDGEISGMNISRAEKKKLGLKNRVYVFRGENLTKEECAQKMKEVLNDFDEMLKM